MGIVSRSQGGSGAGALTQLSDQTLGVAAATITFAAIAQTTSHLWLVVQGRGDTAAANVVINTQLNGDAGANYDRQLVAAAAAVPSSSEALGGTSARVGVLPAASAAAGIAGSFELVIPNYTGTVFNKTLHARGGYKVGTASTNVTVEQYIAHWRSTAAVTQVVLLTAAGNFLAGTRATLYGLT